MSQLIPKLPTVSVVIPVYNEADQLEACLDSLLAEASQLAEIIVVDNNSSDGSLALARRYLDTSPLVKVITEKRQGLVPARNRGFLAASGEIVARIDADTRVQSGWALAIRKHFSANPKTVALDGQTHYFDLPFDNLSASISAFFVRSCNRIVAGFPSMYGPNMALRTKIAKGLAASSCAGKLNEDLDLTIHLRAASQLISQEPAMLVYISGRRLKTSPPKFLRYLANWPRTYVRHGQYLVAAKAYVLVLLFCLLQTLAWPVLKAYDDYERQLSWRRLFELGGDRIIP